ncbi:MAG TPA: C40 family peptidase [Flavobacterium sp.]|uniref:C40 family peptidase n=1 Tax=Flavobacterium sp. TaxID=239 RepID=UPI002C7B4E21|nr:C40 family peptidase [Flavobacterium sp.]HNP31864.1 C40 family peptidase [Flavobacterium sp.]
MRNLFKIALFLIVCCGSSSASNTMSVVVLNKIHSNIAIVFNTDPNKKDTKNRAILNTKNATDIIIEDDTDSYLAEQLINVASDNLGTRYRSGGTTKDGFDCSGLMYSTFRKFDITLPRSSYEMAETGTVIDPENAKKGDLIFFINRGQKRINHVGMVVEVNGDEIKFIHSSTNGGVIISSLKEPYYERTFKQINRVIAEE